MKLYTKEMFLIASEKCEVSMIDVRHIMKYIDEYVIPIELPSDEEIEEQSWGYREVTKDMEIPPNEDWSNGAKWMRDKIQGSNK
jgi:hypothetical protein